MFYRETLKTKISFAQNSNKYLKKRIINFEKIQEYTANLCTVKQEDSNNKKDIYNIGLYLNDESSKIMKNGINKKAIYYINFYLGNSNNIFGFQSEDSKTCTNSFISQSTTDSYLDENKEIEGLIQENKKLEETIIILKNTRNNLSISVEDFKDELYELKSITEVLDI